MPIFLPEKTATSVSALTPREIVKRALEIAGDLCIYTNQHHTIETLGP